MATALIFLFLHLVLLASRSLQIQLQSPNPYLSPHIFHSSHRKMLDSFKIYIYPNHHITAFKDPAELAFYSALLNSTFLTSNPNEAHLFFIPFISSALSTRSISRLIRDIRSTHPYWNRTLGADHFFLHCHGLPYESDRNLVELKKNAVQISCFPTKSGHFIPHKDITLPPLNYSIPSGNSPNYLLNDDSETHEYCVMSYEDGGVGMIGEALREGCVPVVVVESGGRAQDLPMMGVVRWAEIAVFVVGRASGEERRRVVRKVASGGGYGRMTGLGLAAARHFAWGLDRDRYDAFHSVMYQLWVRRHTVRYARVAVSSEQV